MMTDTPPHDHHHTVADAGQCPDCRAWTISVTGEDPYGYLLLFARPGAPDVEAFAVVRSPSPDRDDAITMAWATGCNAGDGYGVGVQHDHLEHLAQLAGRQWFELVTGSDATTALGHIKSSAEVDAFRSALHGHHGCEECGVPLNANPN